MSSETDDAGVVATPVMRVLAEARSGLLSLVSVLEGGGLDELDNRALIGLLQDFEAYRNLLPLVDHQLILEGESRQLARSVGEPSMRRLLVHLLRLSPAEAARRVAAAEACGTRVSVLGEVLEPRRPELAAAQRDGSVSTEQVQIIDTALAKVDRPGFDPADIVAGERLLVGFARQYGTKDLRQLAERVVDAIDPDGTLPDAQVQQDRRHFSMRQCRDGMYAGEFRLTGTVGAKLAAILQPLARPRLDTTVSDNTTTGGASEASTADAETTTAPANAVSATPSGAGAAAGGDGPRPRSYAELDTRTYGQRSHDALEEVCDRILTAGSVVGVGGTPATVIVTVTAQDLTDKLGYATTTDGTLIEVPELLRLAREAEVIPAVLDRTGAVLSLGRTRRIASQSQTLALIARDHGCSFPGCDRPPEWCERHHIREWVDGGSTDLDNLTLLCRYHHHNFAARGWTCRINVDGLPEWRPPRWLDRRQTPRINSRIAAQLLGFKGRCRRSRSKGPGTEASQVRAPAGADP